MLALWHQAGLAPSSTDDHDSLQRLLTADPRALLITVADGRMVGSLIAASDGWRGNLYRLAVSPSWRRRGIASRLVEVGEAQLRADGIRRVTALVLEHEPDAIAFWCTVGYVHDPPMQRYVKML